MTRSNFATSLGFGVVALILFVLQSTVAYSFEDPRDRNSYGTWQGVADRPIKQKDPEKAALK